MQTNNTQKPSKNDVKKFIEDSQKNRELNLNEQTHFTMARFILENLSEDTWIWIFENNRIFLVLGKYYKIECVIDNSGTKMTFCRNS